MHCIKTNASYKNAGNPESEEKFRSRSDYFGALSFGNI